MSLPLDDIYARLSSRHTHVLLAAAVGGEVAFGTFGAPNTADAEIGSVSKGLTGLLYRDAVERGEVSPGTELGEVLGDTTVPYAKVTLEALATHASGLPGLPPFPKPRTVLNRTWRMWRHGENAYGDTFDEVVAAAAGVRMGRPRFAYSNLGFMLLGLALERAAEVPFAELLRVRVTEPLGMAGAYVPATADELRADSLTGRAKSGRAHEPWTGEALGPAGGVRAQSADLAALLTGLVTGSTPGVAALDPVADGPGGTRIGAAWVTTESGGARVTWHNGRTGGFASWVGVDRDAGVGLALVSATAVGLDRVGFAELERLRGSA